MSEHLPDPAEEALAHGAGIGVDPTTEPLPPVDPAEALDPTEAVDAILVDDAALSADGLETVVGRTPTERDHDRVARLEHDEEIRLEAARIAQYKRAPSVRTRRSHFDERLSGPSTAEKNLAEAIERGDTSSEGMARLQAAADKEVQAREQRHRDFLARVHNSSPPDPGLRPITRRERRFYTNAEDRRREAGPLKTTVMFDLEMAFGDKIGKRLVYKEVTDPKTGEPVLDSDGEVKLVTDYEPIIDSLISTTGNTDPGDGSSLKIRRLSKSEVRDIVLERNIDDHGRVLKTRKELSDEVDATMRYVKAEIRRAELQEQQRLANSRATAKTVNARARADVLMPDTPDEPTAHETEEETPESAESLDILKDGIKEFLFYDPYIDKAGIEALSPEEIAELEKNDDAVRLVGLVAPTELLNDKFKTAEERRLLYLTVALRLRALEAADESTIADRERSIAEHAASTERAMIEELVAKSAEPETLTAEELQTLKAKVPERYLDALRVIDFDAYMKSLPVMNLGRYYEEMLHKAKPGSVENNSAKLRLRDYYQDLLGKLDPKSEDYEKVEDRLLELLGKTKKDKKDGGHGKKDAGDPDEKESDVPSMGDIIRESIKAGVAEATKATAKTEAKPTEPKKPGLIVEQHFGSPDKEAVDIFSLDDIDPYFHPLLNKASLTGLASDTSNTLYYTGGAEKTARGMDPDDRLDDDVWFPIRDRIIAQKRRAYIDKYVGEGQGLPADIQREFEARLNALR